MKVVLCGYGKMGRMIEEILAQRGDELAGVVHPGLFASAAEVPEPFDAVVDFSYPGNLPGTLECAMRTGCACVIGTTGLSTEDVDQVRNAAKYAPIVLSANYSVGVAVLRNAVKLVAAALPDSFDCEIVETHHNQKVDAPSGTAKMLLDAVDPDGAYRHVFGREGVVGPRGHEIGVHALRGGTVAGEHSVFFFGPDETLELKHSAASRRIFACGAVKALDFAVGRAPGLYTIDDVLGFGAH